MRKLMFSKPNNVQKTPVKFGIETPISQTPQLYKETAKIEQTTPQILEEEEKDSITSFEKEKRKFKSMHQLHINLGKIFPSKKSKKVPVIEEESKKSVSQESPFSVSPLLKSSKGKFLEVPSPKFDYYKSNKRRNSYSKKKIVSFQDLKEISDDESSDEEREDKDNWKQEEEKK